MNISNETINEIRSKINIVEVISNYIPLSPKGKNYFGVCPFHDDHSPSMSVSEEKQIYTCFSCGATGNVFTFVAKYENIGFYDAVRLLGNKLGYNLGTKETTKDKYSNQYEIYDLATKFYQNELNTSLGKNAIDYLDKRKIDKENIKKFNIGLSISKHSITDYLINKGKKLQDLIDLGISNENGQDLFTNRIMFPLYDLEGRVVAFSGRIYNTKDTSKYINTKETVIFKKGNILYNYHNAKEHLKKNDSIIVMEGFMDVIRASTIGINNCVATMGTALTKQNANLLKKMANNIILCFDGDSAGEEATVSAINIFKELDVVPKVIRLEEDLDPDEYIIKYGKESFIGKINNPITSIEFLITQHKNNKNLQDVEDISKYLDESIKELSSIDDEILVELTLTKLSKEFNIEYNILKNRYDKLKINNKKQSTPSISIEKHEKNESQYDKASKSLLHYMLINDKIIDIVEKQVAYFPNPTIRLLSNEIICYYHKYRKIDIANFISYEANNEELAELIGEIVNMTSLSENMEEEVKDNIKVINSYPQKLKIKDLEEKMKNEKDPIKQALIVKEILSLKGVK